MKTVNFLEAIEANKTRRVMVDVDYQNPDEWFGVGELEQSARNGTLRSSITLRMWIVEPEKIEFECEWVADDENKAGLLFPAYPVSKDKETSLKLNSLIGKKTKVIIEEIE